MLYQRWFEIRDILLARAYEVIDETSAQVAPSAVENFRRFDTMNLRSTMQKSDITKYNTYEKQVQYLRDFLELRASWLDSEITRMYEGGTYEIPVIEKEKK